MKFPVYFILVRLIGFIFCATLKINNPSKIIGHKLSVPKFNSTNSEKEEAEAIRMMIQKYTQNLHDIIKKNQVKKNKEDIQLAEENNRVELEICAIEYKVTKDLKEFNDCCLESFRESLRLLEGSPPETTTIITTVPTTEEAIIQPDIVEFKGEIDNNESDTKPAQADVSDEEIETIKKQYLDILHDMILKSESTAKNKDSLHKIEENSKIKMDICTDEYKETKDIDKFNDCCLENFRGGMKILEGEEMSGRRPGPSTIAPLPSSAHNDSKYLLCISFSLFILIYNHLFYCFL